MRHQKKIVIFFYNRLFDPVVQSNIWLFVEYMSQQLDCRIRVMSYEDTTVPLEKWEEEKIRAFLLAGHEWTRLNWHKGTSLKLKALDFAQGFLHCLKARKDGYRYIVGFASVSGVFASLYAKALGMRSMLTSFEPHSEYGLDSGMWTRESLTYRVMSRLERWAASSSQVVVSGTLAMKRRLEEAGLGYKFFLIPTVVEDERFIYSAADRVSMRTQLGIGTERWVILYSGKFGGLYYDSEVVSLFKEIQVWIPEAFLLIVTLSDHQSLHEKFRSQDIENSDYAITMSPYREIPSLYSAADIGLIAVAPGPSKKFVSNIKVGEYLCCGLPYIIAQGVSDDSFYASNEQVGVVVRDFSKQSISDIAHTLLDFRKENRETQRQRCREFGISYRGLSTLRTSFLEAANRLLADDQERRDPC